MRRREFITLLGGAAAAWPLAAQAQQSHRVPRIGVLLLGTPTSFAPRTQAFVQGLRDLGYVEGRTIAIEWKWGQDRVDRLPDLAAELVRSQVDVIVTGGGRQPPRRSRTPRARHPSSWPWSVIRSARVSSRILAGRAGMPPGSA